MVGIGEAVDISHYVGYLFQFLFYGMTLFFIFYSVVLGFHWFTYSTNKATSTLALAIYLGGSAICFIIMSGAIIAL